jgi:hypothetical protein
VVYCYSNGVVLPNLFSSNAITQSTLPHSFFFNLVTIYLRYGHRSTPTILGICLFKFGATQLPTDKNYAQASMPETGIVSG